jgi:hypothetical protein
MDHQPFEDWIFTKEELSEENNKELSKHLLECKQCADLSESWNQVEMAIFQSAMVAPAQGFTKRFARNLEIKKQKEEQRQSVRYLLIVGLVLVILTTLLLVIFTATHTAGEMIVGATSLVTSFFQAFVNIRAMIFQFLYNLPPLAISAIWLLIAIWGLVMTPIWGVTVWRVSKQGAVQK